MADTRDYQILGVWATGAQTTIPADPVSGTVYRDETVDQTEFEEGWPYDQLVESADYNQKLFLMTSVLLELDQQGVLGWNNTVDYGVTALARGSDNELYVSILANGPASTVVDPVGDLSGTWQTLQDYVGGGGGGPGTNMVQQVYVDGVDYTAGVTTNLTLPADPGGNPANVFISYEGDTLTTGFSVVGTGLTLVDPIPVGVETVVIKVGSTTTAVFDIDSLPDGTGETLDLADRFAWSDQDDSATDKFGNMQQIVDIVQANLSLGTLQIYRAQHETASGVNGGLGATSAWTARTLNTEVDNEIAGASLAANTVTLPAGSYILFCFESHSGGDYVRTRIRDITNNVNLGYSHTADIGSGGFSNLFTSTGRLVAAGPVDLQLQYWRGDSQSTVDLGNPTGSGGPSGDPEVYAELLAIKVA